MSTAQRGEPGTAVARTENRPTADRALAGLDAAGQRLVLEQRMRRTVLQQVANESWGQALSPIAQRAIAAYMVRFNLDVGEVEILGGRIYRNGQYYKRRIAEMRTRGLVEWSLGDHIGPNAELDAMAAAGDPWAKEEQTRRRRERIRWEVPSDATHAYVTHVKLKGDENPLEGCDWITPKRIKKGKFGEKLADPVGAEEPEKTVITRAWRRVGLIAAAEIPELRQEEEVMDVGAVEVSEEVERIDTEEDARELSARRPRELMPASRADAPYEFDDAAPTNAAEPVRVTPAPKSDAVRHAAATAANVGDPYADDDDHGGAEANTRPEPAAESPGNTRREATASHASPARHSTTSGAGAFKLPFNIGLAKIKTPLAEISTEDLTRALKFATDVGKYSELVEAISLVLDDRRYGDAQQPTQATGDGQ